MRGVITLVLLSLSACGSSKPESEARQYQIMKSQNSLNDKGLCDQAGKVAQAYLNAENTEKYQEWKTTENQNCKMATATEELNQSMKAADDAIGNLY